MPKGIPKNGINQGWFKKGHKFLIGNEHRFGKKNSKYQKKIISEYMKKNNPMKRKEVREKSSESHIGKYGKESSNWRGGKSSQNKIIRGRIEFRLWRESVFARDNWTCQKYGIKGGKLHPHHIKSFSQYPELRFAIDNGITLSEKAHRKFHKKYGIKNIGKKQIKDFLKKKI